MAAGPSAPPMTSADSTAAISWASFSSISQGKSVYLYTPGLPQSDQNRALSGSLTAARRELKNWGVLFTDGGRKRLITAEEARTMKAQGRHPTASSVLTPLAKEILEGSD